MTDEELLELEDMIESIDIVEFISQFVELEEKNGELWGLSPFSDERTPSFSIRRETNRFYCFSTGIGGTVYTFVKLYYKCTATEALDILRKYLVYDGSTHRPHAKLAATIICRKYKKPNKARKVSNCNIYPENCMEKYEKNAEKLSLWEAEGISKEALDEFQVHYDAFSNRLVYPIRNNKGEIVNIGGRTLDPQWKEKKLRKYTYFSGWGEMDVIYGLFENMKYILKKREIIIFEGCKSVLLARSWGIYNTGALLTSHLNPCQMKILAMLGVRVVFALDKEVRVRDDYNISRLKKYVNVEYFWDKEDLLDEKDAPVDKGIEVFQKLYEGRLKYR